MHDYGYKFNFPCGYDPGISKVATDYYFCQKTFDDYINVIQSCVYHVKGPLTGQTLILSPWQRDVVAAIFCLLHKVTGRRRYREAFIYLPRKNGKSMFCSALVIAYLVLDPEQGKQVISAAGSADQASLIYKPIRVSLFNKNNPLNSRENVDPNRRFKVLASPRRIISENELNEYFPITADGERNHGLNASFSVMDELHVWKEKQGLELYEAIETSMSARKSPLNVIITTAGNIGDSMCNRKFEAAKRVCENSDDDETFLPVLYFLTDKDDWEDEANWYKANPQLGKSVSIEYYREKYKKAKKDATFLNSFKKLHLNIQTDAANKFLDYQKWSSLNGLVESELHGLDACGGLDMSYKHDLCAFVLEIPHNGIYHIITLLWIPEGHKFIDFYRKMGWIERGEIIVTDGNGIDFSRVRRDIVAICEFFNIIEIAFDPRFAVELCQVLYNEHNLPMVEQHQSPNYLSESLKDIAAGILDEKFKHDGNTCASWQVSNATAKHLENNLIKLIKPKGDDNTLRKVDFVAALSMAHSRVMFNEQEHIGDLLNSGNYSMF